MQVLRRIHEYSQYSKSFDCRGLYATHSELQSFDLPDFQAYSTIVFDDGHNGCDSVHC